MGSSLRLLAGVAGEAAAMHRTSASLLNLLHAKLQDLAGASGLLLLQIRCVTWWLDAAGHGHEQACIHVSRVRRSARQAL